MIGSRNSGPDLSSRAALGFLRNLLPDVDVAEAAPTFIDQSSTQERPTLAAAELLEHPKMRAIAIGSGAGDSRVSGFGGFLDGAEKVQVITYLKGIPAVLGTVSAAIRSRVEKRLSTWAEMRPAVRKRLYLPLDLLNAATTSAHSRFEVVDTSRDEQGNPSEAHPLSLIDEARRRIQYLREDLEVEFAKAWIDREDACLFIDGGISADATVVRSEKSVGVVKSHRRLYVENEALPVLFALEKGERSSVFRVSPRSRHSVASWYLRIRSARGQDPLWGLVRIEIADTGDAVARANEISKWVLAESSPLSLPDGRWDKMAYGIRDTEEFLRAIS